MKAKQQEEGMSTGPKRQEREEPSSLPACSRLWASTWSPSPALNPSSPATGLPLLSSPLQTQAAQSSVLCCAIPAMPLGRLSCVSDPGWGQSSYLQGQCSRCTGPCAGGWLPWSWGLPCPGEHRRQLRAQSWGQEGRGWDKGHGSLRALQLPSGLYQGS